MVIMNKDSATLRTGSLVEVTRRDGRQYKGIVVETYPSRNAFYVRLTESEKGKVSTSSWSRYGIESNGIYQMISECVAVNIIAHPEVVKLEDASDTMVYRTKDPDTKKIYTFSTLEGYGGWSESSEEDLAIVESCYRITESRQRGEDTNA